MMVEIPLYNKLPTVDGFYLFKFNEKSEPHLVVIKTGDDGVKVLIPENPKIKGIRLSSNHEEIFKYAFFSELINII